MRRLAQELRDTSRMFAGNPGMVFLAVLVFGLAISTVVQNCRREDLAISGSVRMSRAFRAARANAIWRGAGVDRSLLRLLAYPRAARNAKAPEKHATPRANPPRATAPAPAACTSLSDLRFPEFNLLIPPL